MEQENNEKAVEETEETVKAAEPETNGKKDKNDNLFKIGLVVLCAVAFIIIMVKSGGVSTSDDCVIVPQAAWGQPEQQVWTELDTPATAKAIATFTMTEPELPFEYASRIYEVYTKQIYEVRYYDADNNEIMRIAKGKMCGSDIYTVNGEYASRNTLQVGDLSVTEYGTDMDSVAIATWVNGEYSYFIGAMNGNTFSREEMEAMVQGVE